MKWIALLVLVLNAPAAFAKTPCTYTIDPGKSRVEGTGYKFVEKTGVTAKIFGVQFSKKSAPSLVELFTNFSADVDLMTLDSGNEIRDNNLRQHFLSGLKEKAVAKILMKSYTPEEMTGTLRLNGVTKDVTFKVTSSQTKDALQLTAASTIDGGDYQMLPALKTLEKYCRAFHTKDGKTKTWKDFGIRAIVSINKVCR